MPYLLHQLLSEAAARDPERVAVRAAGRTLTYGELDASANALARTLIQAGVRPGDRVGIHVPKRPEMVVAVYGALKAGAAYVPLDPLAPVPRLVKVADDCGIAALVTTPTGHRYVLVILTRGLEKQADAYRLVAELSRLVYDERRK